MIWETILRVLYLLKPLVPTVLIVAALTMAALLLLVLPCGRFWINKRSASWLGMFFCLRGRGCVHLACVWLRFCLCIALLIPLSQITAQHCLLLVVPMVTELLADTSLKHLVGRILGDIALLAGVLLANLLFGYMQGSGGDIVPSSLYVVLCIFVLLFNIYLFLLEIENISENRSGSLR